MSRSEMAALRSSLPSQKKYKGRQLAEKMGIKLSGAGGKGRGGGDTLFRLCGKGRRNNAHFQALPQGGGGTTGHAFS